jgi:small subunit ribosomal protein S14
MARESLIAREAKRVRLVAKYADVRKTLKAEGKWDELDKLPRNSSKKRLHNRCKLTGRPKDTCAGLGCAESSSETWLLKESCPV